ncbi:MAG TPA: hypothetical protein VL961_00510 [Acidimicrobiales bacterium]|nr:hypothetical protein [Acidimicrobiales bacterium]
MSVCSHCGEEMLRQVSCSPDGYVVAGVPYQPVRWGAEKPPGSWDVSGPCTDCGTPVGGVHHPGCCVEQCPACLGQVLSCPCHAPFEECLTTAAPKRCSSHRRILPT